MIAQEGMPDTNNTRLETVRLVLEELERATIKFPPFNSPHEGYAVLLEEVDELWDAVKMQYSPERDEQMRLEAIQVAAMALRFLDMLSQEHA